MSTISIDRVTKVFANGHAAVRDVTLETTENERLVIVGPSGSGKSTVLRLIAGLERVTSGRITIDRQDVTRLPPQERDIAMVFQSYALYPHKNVRQNLAFSLELRGLSRPAIAARIAAAAAMLGLEELLDRRPSQLSGGQRQRVALGRAIVREPKAFLLDEPLSNLDPQLRVRTRTELALLHRQLATTMIYVTHDQEEAMTLGTRIAVMRDGAVEQVAPPIEMFEKPANTFVAGFVGAPAMNLWPCRYVASTTGPRIVSEAFSIEIDSVATAALPSSTTLTIGVRPHDLEITGPEHGDARGRVEVIEPLGSATLIHLRTETPTAERVRALVSPDVPVAVDRVIGFRLRRDRLHLFDGASGRRLG